MDLVDITVYMCMCVCGGGDACVLSVCVYTMCAHVCGVMLCKGVQCVCVCICECMCV